MNLNQLQSLIEPHLEEIENLLPPVYKLTLVCRYSDEVQAKDADIILTLDQLPMVIKALQRFDKSVASSVVPLSIADALAEKLETVINEDSYDWMVNTQRDAAEKLLREFRSQFPKKEGV